MNSDPCAKHYAHLPSACKAAFDAPPRRTPTTGMPDGPLLGNGDLATVVAGPAERLRWHLGKNDFWCRDTLRARGAFLVSARRTGGRVSEVSILSERGGTCRLAMPRTTSGSSATWRHTASWPHMPAMISRSASWAASTP